MKCALTGTTRRIGIQGACLSLVIAAIATQACGRLAHLDFDDLRTADRIELNADESGFPGVGTITTTDPVRIQKAAAFFNGYHDGWINAWSGGAAPLFITFYRGDKKLQFFGVGPKFVAVGTLAKYPPPEEIAPMVKELGLPWPPKGY
jgi:hypothetical protein